jgi:hypothetical protein
MPGMRLRSRWSLAIEFAAKVLLHNGCRELTKNDIKNSVNLQHLIRGSLEDKFSPSFMGYVLR